MAYWSNLPFWFMNVVRTMDYFQYVIYYGGFIEAMQSDHNNSGNVINVLVTQHNSITRKIFCHR